MTLTLRHYQKKAIEATWQYLADHSGDPIAVLPTGTGKSLVVADFIKRALTEFPETRILVLQHVKELIAQNVAELVQYWQDAPVGVYSAGLGKKETRAQVTFASIQSIHRKAYAFQDPPFDLVLVDECHLIPRNADTTYRKFLSDLRVINPLTRVVGFTATAFRTDSGMLHQGEDAIFSAIAYEYNISDAVAAGYLVPPVSTTSSVQIDTSNVGTRGGEFIAGQLESAATDPETVDAIADEIVRHGTDRKGWLFFGSGIKHCTLMRDALVKRGVSCECIFGDTPSAERDRLIAAYKRQEIRCLSAMNVLLTGFNAPHADLLAMGRPTKSLGLWIQSVGRVLRTFPGKTNGLVLCFGGNIARHGPVDRPFVKSPRKGVVGENEAPEKSCPNCKAANPISVLMCHVCGFEFPPSVTKIDTRASSGAMLSSQIQPEWCEVKRVTFALHPGRAGKPPTLRADYWCGLIKHSEWICLEHQGYARQKACSWWQRRAPGTNVPSSVAEALTATKQLAIPEQIQIKPNGKFFEIVSARFA